MVVLDEWVRPRDLVSLTYKFRKKFKDRGQPKPAVFFCLRRPWKNSTAFFILVLRLMLGNKIVKKGTSYAHK